MQEIQELCPPPPDRQEANVEKDHPHCSRMVLHHLQQLSGKEAQRLRLPTQSVGCEMQPIQEV